MIDPKQIEEWKARLMRPVFTESMWAAEALYALLAEREEMQAEIRRLEGLNAGRAMVVLTDEVAAVLRLLEWSGWYEPTTEAMCPVCGELKVCGRHAPDCRLAALLKGT